jgi:hypothetical protein
MFFYLIQFDETNNLKIKFMKNVLFGLLAFMGFLSNAQNAIEWKKCIGGTSFDEASSILQTTDGGYVVGGYSNSTDGDVSGNHGSADFWVVKLSSSGALQWQKCFGGTAGDYLTSIQQTSDGGYVLAGSTASNNGDVTGNHGFNDGWVVKLSNLGVLQWQKCLGGSNNEFINSIIQTTDGGFVVAGSTESNNGDVLGNNGSVDAWVVKLTSLGVVQWQNCLGGTFNETVNDIQQTTDGGYILASKTTSNNGDVSGNHSSARQDVWIVKLSSLGDLQWQKCFGGSLADEAFSIQQTTDGGYVFAGSTNSIDGNIVGNLGNYDIWVVKMSNLGVLQWQQFSGGTSGDIGRSIKQTSEGGYIVVGYTQSFDGDASGTNGSVDALVVKLSSFGATQWQKCFGGTSEDYGFTIQKTTDGGYVLAGYTISTNGDVSGNHGLKDAWVIKLSGTLSLVEPSNSNSFSFFPNPVTICINLNLENEYYNQTYTIRDILGKTIIQGKISGPSSSINIESLSNGVYFIAVGQSKNIKFIKE